MFSQNLKKLKENNGVSNYKLAKSIGCSQSTIANWVEGKTLPDSETLLKIASYFNVSTDYLLGDQNNIKVYDEHDNIVVIDDETRDIIDSLRTNPEMKILFSVSKKATKEDILKAVKIIEALRNED